MNHSLLFADRTTHLKIASIALLGVLIVVAIGITARLTGAQAAPAAAVIKAGAPGLDTRSVAIHRRRMIEPSSPHGDWPANPGGVVWMSLPV